MGKGSAVVTAPPSALVNLAKALSLAQQDVADMEIKLSTAKARASIAEKKLVDEMTTQDIVSFRTPFGGFRSEPVVYPNVTDKEALNAYVVKNRKLKFLYTTQVHGGKLKSFIKELLTEGKELPPGIDPYTTTVVRRFK